MIAQGLINKARSGDTTSMIFFLKTQAGWRETMQVAAAKSDPENTLDLSGLSDETLQAMLDLVGNAAAAQGEGDNILDGVALPEAR